MPFAAKGLFVGLATVDILYMVDEIPGRDEKISVPGQLISAGGPATNAAITFAFLGGRAGLVSAVGRHPLASIIRHDLRDHAIRLHDLTGRSRETPPLSSIMVRRGSGDRTVVSANATVLSPRVEDFNPEWMLKASILLVDGHYMPLCIAAARHARAQGIRVVLDSGSWKRGMERLLPLVDTAICSADYRPPGCRNTTDVMEFLQDRNIQQVAITAGAMPIRLVDARRRSRVAVEQVRPLDTLGAGDILHGAFCFYASQHRMSFHEAVARAAQVATFSTRYPGTREWMARKG
jgi:sugar/nucleoside kinase (ribokinase family)